MGTGWLTPPFSALQETMVAAIAAKAATERFLDISLPHYDAA
jgi:hypothetical protein